MQAGIGSPLGHKVGMTTVLNHPTVVEDEDLVGVADGTQAVGDDKRGAALHQPAEGDLKAGLGEGVDRAGRLVEDKDAGVRDEGAGKGDNLLLAH